MAEWLGTGLQNLLQRFDSASHLQEGGSSEAAFFVSPLLQLVIFMHIFA